MPKMIDSGRFHLALGLLGLLILLATSASALHVASTGNEENVAFCARAEVLVCENFENRTTGQSIGASPTVHTWKNNGWGSPFVGVFAATDDKNDGAKSGKLTYAEAVAGVSGNSGPGYNTTSFTPTRTIYIRHYVKFSSNWVWSTSATKGLIIGSQFGGMGAPRTHIAHFNGTWGGMDAHADGSIKPFPPNTTNSPVVSRNVWHCVEHKMTVNSLGSLSDGEMFTWLDGNLILNYPQAKHSTLDNQMWASLMISGFWNCVNNDCTQAVNSHPEMYRWEDNVVVSKAPIGCTVGAPPAADTTDPTVGAPTISGTSGVVTVSVTASDAGTGVANVRFKIDGANFAASSGCDALLSAPASGTPASGTWVCSWNTATAATPNATYEITAIPTDGAGNDATSAGTNVTVANSTGSPSAGLVSSYNFNEAAGTPVVNATRNAGVVLYDVYAGNEAEIRGVIDACVARGCDTAVIGPRWQHWETGAGFDWTALDNIMAYADAQGLKIQLGFWSSVDSTGSGLIAESNLMKTSAGATFVQDGQAIPSFSSATAVAKMVSSMTTLIDRYKATYTIDRVIFAFTPYSETEYWWGTLLDYGDPAKTAWEAWLTSKYTTIGNMNTLLGTAYASFAAAGAAPPTTQTTLYGKAWYRFRHDQLRTVIDTMCATIHAEGYLCGVQFGLPVSLAGLRGTALFPFLLENVDYVQSNDAATGNHYFSNDVVRTGAAGRLFGSEFSNPASGTDTQWQNLYTQSYALGASHVDGANWHVSTLATHQSLWNTFAALGALSSVTIAPAGSMNASGATLLSNYSSIQTTYESTFGTAIRAAVTVVDDISPAIGLSALTPPTDKRLAADDGTGTSNLTLEGGANFAAASTGNGLSLDGINGMAWVSSASHHFATAYTIGGLITRRSSGRQMGMLTHGEKSTAPYLEWEIAFNADGTAYCGNSAGGSYHKLNGATVVPEDMPTRGFCTYDGSSLKLYLNGVQDATANVTGTIALINNTTVFGSWMSLNYCDCLYEDWVAYDVALTPEQIAAFEGTTTPPPPAPPCQNPAAPFGDATLDLSTTNHCGDSTLTLATSTTTDDKVQAVALVRLDMSGQSGTLSSATATLNLVDAVCSAAIDVKVARVVNLSPVIGRATGVTADGVLPWTTSTATGTGNGQFPMAMGDLTATGSATVAVTDVKQPWTWTITTIAQYCVDHPTDSCAVVFYIDATDADAVQGCTRVFASAEHPATALRPNYAFVPDTTPTPTGTKRLNFTWSRSSVLDFTGWIVRRKVTAGAYAEIARTGPSITLYEDAGLLASTEYCYQAIGYLTVSATGGTLYSNPTTEACATTPTGVQKPQAPSARAVEFGDSTATIRWGDRSSTEDGFNIWRTDNGATAVQIDSVGPNITTYTDTTPVAGHTYCYSVESFNAGGASTTRSAPVCGQLLTMPSDPTGGAVSVP